MKELLYYFTSRFYSLIYQLQFLGVVTRIVIWSIEKMVKVMFAVKMVVNIQSINQTKYRFQTHRMHQFSLAYTVYDQEIDTKQTWK